MVLAEDRRKQIIAAVLLTITGALLGYILALMALSVWHKNWNVGAFYLIENFQSLYQKHFHEWRVATVMVVLPTIGGLLLSTRMLDSGLTQYGVTKWQTIRDMKRNRFFANPATGFLLGKTGKPSSNGKLIVSAKFPHCLLVAPTGAGKTVGFTIPNLLTYLGSAIVLDVKGECFEKTARHRAGKGHRVLRFGPTEYGQPTHRWNPLSRIEKMTNPAQRMAALDKLATLFLVAQSPQAESFLPDSREVFVSCALLAFEQGKFNLRHVHKLAFNGEGSNNDRFAAYAKIVRDGHARGLFQKLANTASDTLSAYLSILDSSGFSPWANPHICAVTAGDDFDFGNFRRAPHTVYFTVTSEDIPTIAPLVRMFFAEAIAKLQEKEPGPDEPFPVMFLLDEFQRLGKMKIIVDSISLLRSYGGNVAIITQSIPDLDRVYGVEDRKAIQASSGLKLYLTPSEEDTVEELSQSVGTTTKKVTTRSKSMKDGVFGANVTERTEEYPLLTKDDARRLPSDEIIIVVNAAMPIRAKRIQYYADRELKRLYDAQDPNAPYPLPKRIITEADYDEIKTVESVSQAIAGLAAERVKQADRPAATIAKQERRRSVEKRTTAAKAQAPRKAGKGDPVKNLAKKDAQNVEAVCLKIDGLFKRAGLGA